MLKSTDGVWTAPDGGSTIDVSVKVVTAITTHFSEWGVFGDAMLSITANTEATFNIADGTKLVIKGTMDNKVRPLLFLSSPGVYVQVAHLSPPPSDHLFCAIHHSWRNTILHY